MENNADEQADIPENSASDERYSKLKKSYDDLRKDYTKKCQALSQMKTIQTENGKHAPETEKAQVAARNERLKQDLSDDAFICEKILADQKITKSVVENYLLALKNNLPPVLIADGGEACGKECIKPSTLREAGELAKKSLIIK